VIAPDHLVVTATDLAAGAAEVEAALGVPLEPGGRHATMGTHNRLLSLGPGLYLEVIAPDPGLPAPAQPRWFDLDRFAGPARLTHWAARTGDLDAALAAAPPGTGRIHALARDAFRWRVAIPEDGRHPFGGAFPLLIEWQGPAHPADRLTDRGCRLERLTLRHPAAAALRAALEGLADPRIAVEPGGPGLEARIATPAGTRVLG
jgi:hypothetical protein